jgi:hypothetical protein
MEIGMKIQRILERGGLKGRDVATKIEDGIREKTDQLQQKVEERREIELRPMTKAELAVVCKKALQDGLKGKFLSLLTNHLRAVQEHKVEFLWEVILRKDFIKDTVLGNWLFAIIDDHFLEAAMKELTDDGAFSEKDRILKLAQIDKEIVLLESEIEKLLA